MRDLAREAWEYESQRGMVFGRRRSDDTREVRDGMILGLDSYYGLAILLVEGKNKIDGWEERKVLDRV